MFWNCHCIESYSVAVEIMYKLLLYTAPLQLQFSHTDCNSVSLALLPGVYRKGRVENEEVSYTLLDTGCNRTMMAVYRPLDMFSERLGRMRVYCYTCIVANFLMLLDRDVPRIHENVSRVCSLVEGY